MPDRTLFDYLVEARQQVPPKRAADVLARIAAREQEGRDELVAEGRMLDLQAERERRRGDLLADRTPAPAIHDTTTGGE